MTSFTPAQMERLLSPYLDEPLRGATAARQELPPDVLDRDARSRLFERLGLYLDLLLRWNGRTNLTALRDPTEIVERHFGESLYAARCVAASVSPSTCTLCVVSVDQAVPLAMNWG